MRTLSMLLFAAAMASGATSAGAALYTWNTTGALSAGSGITCAGGVACKTTFTSTSGGMTLTARAYSTPVYDTTAPFNISGNWVEAKIAAYGGGLGVANVVSGDSASETSAPEHAVDNQGVKDIVIFELPAGTWDPDAFKLGWADTDSDVQAWVGGANLGAGYDFRNVCFSGCTGSAQTLAGLGFTDIGAGMPLVSGGTASPGGGSDAGGVNVPTGVAASFGTSSTGRYVIMSGNLGVGSITADNDFFKISQFSANRVPSSGTLLLMLLGLLILFAGARSRGVFTAVAR